ncbi:MAG TPA: hypothetical protein VMY37_22315 [Thermoguttaceae bacterium]|nr:hypothetical protein [Thermoguttaceae bacterium]
MPKSPSRRLVIDASIAGTAGDKRKLHSAGKRCRDFLEAVLVICHRMVWTPEIGKEWSKHQSSFSRKWRTRMYARKKVDCVELPDEDTLWRRLETVEATDEAREEMLKDCLLIEAAMATDGCVASLDDRARRLLGRASEHVSELRGIVWVNPDQPEEHAIAWLEGGARPETGRMLGHAC